MEREKQYGIQVAMNMRQSMSKRGKEGLFVGKNNRENRHFFQENSLRITHFSQYYRKSDAFSKRLEDNNRAIERQREEVRELKEKIDEIKHASAAKEAELSSKITTLQQDLNSLTDSLRVKQAEFDQYKTAKEKEWKKIREKEKEAEEKNREKMSVLLEEHKREINDLEEELRMMKSENEGILGKNKRLEEVINEQNKEIERLNKLSSLNLKLTKEENEELLKELKEANEKITQMTNGSKAKQLQNKQEIKLQLLSGVKAEEKSGKIVEVLNKEKLNLSNKIKELNHKIMKLTAENEKNNTIKTRNLSEFGNNITIIRTPESVNYGDLVEIKGKMVDFYERFNVNLLKMNDMFGKLMVKYDNKIKKIKEKIESKVKGDIVLKKKRHSMQSKGNIDAMRNGFKNEISKLEKEKQKLEVQISNYDMHYQRQTKEITSLRTLVEKCSRENVDLNVKINEINIKFEERESMIKTLRKQLEMYIIENSGKSKIIEERNNEIDELKNKLKSTNIKKGGEKNK